MTLVHGRDIPRKLYKALSHDWTQYGFRWKLGKNVDPLPWRPEGFCSHGGLYFTTYENLHLYAQEPYDEGFIGQVLVDDDEEVWQEEEKWKAHRVTLLNVVAVRDLPAKEYYDFICPIFQHPIEPWQNMVNGSVMNMRYVLPEDWQVAFDKVGLTKSPEEYDLAVKEDKEAMLHAVEKNPWIVKFLPRIDAEMAMTAVRCHGETLKYIAPELQTEKMCIVAVSRLRALRYVAQQTDRVCMESVKNNPHSLRYVQNRRTEIIEEAVNRNARVLMYLDAEEQSEKVCLFAIRKCSWNFMYVRNKTPKLCKEAVALDPQNLEFIPHEMQSEEICLGAVKRFVETEQYVRPDLRHLFHTRDRDYQ